MVKFGSAKTIRLESFFDTRWILVSAVGTGSSYVSILYSHPVYLLGRMLEHIEKYNKLPQSINKNSLFVFKSATNYIR